MDTIINKKFSVLMSIYDKENPKYLEQCFDSIKSQTVQPEEIILVEDGELTSELYLCIKKINKEFSNLKIISYKKNMGLGYALAKGLSYCKNEIVARMDTDDICKPNRFEEEIKILINNKNIDVVGSWIEEFINTTDNIKAIRKVPETTKEISNYAKSRNPMNHPTVMFKKSVVIEAGNYQPFTYFEDYYLWIRILLNGGTLYNIQDSLLYFRQSESMYGRRGGTKYIKTEINFYNTLYKLRFINYHTFIKDVTIRIFVRIIPNIIRSYIYNKLLRYK